MSSRDYLGTIALASVFCLWTADKQESSSGTWLVVKGSSVKAMLVVQGPDVRCAKGFEKLKNDGETHLYDLEQLTRGGVLSVWDDGDSIRVGNLPGTKEYAHFPKFNDLSGEGAANINGEGAAIEKLGDEEAIKIAKNACDAFTSASK